MIRTRYGLSLLAVLGLVFAIAGSNGVAADGGAATYRYLVAAGFVPEVGADLCTLPPGCPAVAVAANGDSLEFAGEGTFSIHPKSADGGGTFTHLDAAGDVVASGTWTATDLLSFHSYGSASAQGFPETWEGGLAVLRIQLDPGDPGGPVFDAVLKVICALGDQIPASAADGARVNVQGGANFNHALHRSTLFIRQ